MMYRILVLSKTCKCLLRMRAELLLCACYVNILFIYSIKTRFSFQAFRSIRVTFLSFHFQRLIIFLQKTIRSTQEICLKRVCDGEHYCYQKKFTFYVIRAFYLLEKTLSAKKARMLLIV